MSDAATPVHDDADRQRRRVLWAMPTGLYLIGSRHGDDVNLMTANLVVQVCLEPKLVAAAIEASSVTAGLIAAGGAFSVSMLARTDKDIVRRFVKPVTEVTRDDDGTVTAMAGHQVLEAGAAHLPVLSVAVGHITCTLTQQDPLGSHILFIGEVEEVAGEPADVLRMEDTRMHYGG
jgi:flavin reductase (DIM6/NTAB) family NADH-FMN oxidoreductase RutF